MLERKARPVEVTGTTYHYSVGCGKLYVTVGRSNDGYPFEVLARLGKSGGCAICQNEALGRVISIGLQCGVPVEEYIHTLDGLRCPNPNMFPPEEKCLSCPDGISRALRDFVFEKLGIKIAIEGESNSPMRGMVEGGNKEDP